MSFTAKDNFDSYSDGGLSSLNGGSGNWNSAWTAANVGVTIQGITVYQGTKAVKDLANSTGFGRDVTPQTSGKYYFAMRAAQTNKTYYFVAEDPPRYGIRFNNNGDIQYIDYLNVWKNLIYGYSANVWYVFEVSWTDVDTVNFRIRAGTTSFTADTGNTETIIGRKNDVSGFHWYAADTETEMYVDNFTTDDPLAHPFSSLPSHYNT